MSRGPSRSDGRGQTLPDFAVGIAVFLLTLTFVSVFVPQLVAPFEDQEQSVVADRVASDLESDLSGDGSPSELDENATRAFFDQSESEALEQFGVASWYSVNVTLRDGPSRTPDSEVLCGDADGFWLADCDSGTDRFAVGQPVPRDGTSVATAQRTVYAVDADGSGTEYVVLEVSIW